MRNGVKVATHMLVSCSSVLLFIKLFHSLWELAGYCFVTMLLATLLYYLRNNENTFWKFIVGHIGLLLGGFFFLFLSGFHKWYLIIWCFWILYSCILRFVPAEVKLDEPTITYIMILGVGYLCAYFLIKSSVAECLYLVITVVVFLLYLLYKNLKSVDEFILVGGLSNQEDEQGIGKLNQRLSIIYVGVFGVLLAVFSLFRIDGVWRTIKGWLYSMLRFLFMLIPIKEEMTTTEEVETEKEAVGFVKEIAEGEEMTKWAQIASEVIRDIVIVFAIIIILYAIVRGAIYIYRRFYNRQMQYSIGDKMVESLLAEQEVTRKKKPAFLRNYDRSPARRIRRMYKKYLKRVGKQQIKRFPYMSPVEQMQFLCEHGISEEVLENIRYLYEKARYSKNLITEDDVSTMKIYLSRK